MIIRTQYKTNANGTGQILAKGGGKQRTIPFDPAVSSDRNHGNAAGTLALVLIQGDTARRLAAKHATHDSNDSGTQHGFSLP